MWGMDTKSAKNVDYSYFGKAIIIYWFGAAEQILVFHHFLTISNSVRPKQTELTELNLPNRIEFAKLNQTKLSELT